jgi:DNA-binding SARP family transcriptional activator/tetratricopeptide (TPR) repeat protein
MAEVTVAVLGPFELRVDGRVVPVPGRRVRALLAALALRAGRLVSTDSLAERVWDRDLPRWPRGSVQTLANRLRPLTGTDVVRTGVGGYLLDVPPDAVDALRFQRLLEAARGAGPAESRARLAAALELWRGEPLVGAGSDLLEREVAPALLERYLAALEWRIDLDLAGGRPPPELVAELRELASRYPLREPLWVRLIGALDAAGRPAEALDTYQVIRGRLVEELGADPSPELRQAYARVLADADDGGVPAAPRQLPPEPTGFLGRAGDLAALDRLLAGGGPVPRVVAVHGAGGVGKTALAVRWAHRVADRFPDGQLHLNLRGYGPDEPVDPAVALDVVLRALGVPPAAVPPSLPERSALLRTGLAGRRVLLLVDNARDAAQVRPLLPGGASLALVTSRNELRGLEVRDGAVRRQLPELPTDESVALVRSAIGAGRATAEPAAVAELVELCGRLPLALVVAGQRAARFPDAPVAELVGELRAGQDRLDVLADPHDLASDPRAVFSWSYRALDGAAARTFRLLGLHPGPRVHLLAAAALLGVGPAAARRLLDLLVSVHLLESDRRDVYRFHDLLRVYAAERAGAEESGAGRDAATRRMLDWYLHSLYAARVATFGAPGQRPGPPVAGVRPMEFTGMADATARYDQSHDVLVEVVEHAAAHGHDEHAWRMAELLGVFQQLRCHVDGSLRTTELGVRCAERSGDDAARAQSWQARAAAMTGARRYDEAIRWAERSLRLAERIGDHRMMAAALVSIGLNHEAAGRVGAAISAMERSVAAVREPVGGLRLAHSLLSLGAVEGNAGRLDAAREHGRQALAIYRELGAQYHQSLALANLAEAHLELGDPRTALRDADESLALLDDIDDQTSAVNALIVRGRALAAADPAGARRSYRRALVILRGTGDPRIEAIHRLMPAAP